MKTQNNSWNKWFWGMTIVALVLGLLGLFDRITNGHTNANYGSSVPFGAWVVGYTYRSGLSARAFRMSARVCFSPVKALA